MTQSKPYRCKIAGTVSFRSVLIWADNQQQAEERAAMFFGVEVSDVLVRRKWGY